MNLLRLGNWTFRGKQLHGKTKNGTKPGSGHGLTAAINLPQSNRKVSRALNFLENRDFESSFYGMGKGANIKVVDFQRRLRRGWWLQSTC
jgi:hypothetical protein